MNIKMPEYAWVCMCCAFQAKLKAPPVFEMNCHCHSCVAPARYLDAKYPETSKSGLVNGGVGKAFFRLEDIELPKGGGGGGRGLTYLKVGDDGEKIRSYTTCCGTLFNSSGGKCFPVAARPLTRNNIIQKSDGSPYVSLETPTDVNTKYAYGDYTLPEPHFEGRSPAVSAGFSALAPLLPDDDAARAKYDQSWFKVGAEVNEVVPITWEN
jgi:hypothetical protein